MLQTCVDDITDLRLKPIGYESVSRLKRLIHLASVIDLKRDKLECAITVAHQAQIRRQLEALVGDFQRDYEDFLEATEPERPPHMIAA
ncbi:MAG TPA: hypothetical protein VGM54_04885 [Chthoniobacter sp.]|jgi:uncharacterized coiled-coil protein SlyX